MEHELFQSKLKASVDGAFVSDIIRSSSSGLNSHRTAAIELIIERSIRGRHDRTFKKAKNSLRPDPTTQPKGEAPDTLTLQVQSPTPTIASQPPSQSLTNGTTGIATSLESASANHEASQESSALSKSVKGVEKVPLREEPPADVKTNLSLSEDFVELACLNCNAKQLRSSLTNNVWCSPCISRIQVKCRMKCGGCGVSRFRTADACVKCHKKFK